MVGFGFFSVDLGGWVVGLDDGRALHVSWSGEYRSFVVALCDADYDVLVSWGLDEYASLPSRADVEWVLSSAGFGGVIPWGDRAFRSALSGMGAPVTAF